MGCSNSKAVPVRNQPSSNNAAAVRNQSSSNNAVPVHNQPSSNNTAAVRNQSSSNNAVPVHNQPSSNNAAAVRNQRSSNNTAAVRNQSSSGTSPYISPRTVPGETKCVIQSRFFDNVDIIKKQLRDKDVVRYKTLEQYLIAIIKCLSELDIELEKKKITDYDNPKLLKYLKVDFPWKFYQDMKYLGLFKDKKSKAQTIIARMLLSISSDTMKQLKDALKIFMCLIILLIRILDPKLNEYQQRFRVTTNNDLVKIKITLLNTLDEIFATISNNENKAQFIAKFDKIISRSSVRLRTYNLDLSINDDNDTMINTLLEQIKNAKGIDEHNKEIIDTLKKNQDYALTKLRTGGSILYKHQIQQIRKLLTNKKLTEKQKEQYKRKINKLKLKIAKEQKLNKINEIKDKLKKANTNLKRKKLTDKQKQQLQIKIKNYKNQIKKLSS